MSSRKAAWTRREFLARSAGAVGVPYVLTAAAAIAQRRRTSGREVPASEKIGIGFLGFGRRGYELGSVLSRVPKVRCVVACDVDSRRRSYATKYLARRQPGLKTCEDFREVLGNREVDAVVICVPDHWHAVMAVEAAKAGKDVFCESPLSLTIGEARAMVTAARRYGRVFQTGTYRRAMSSYDQACQAIRDGRIGQVKTVHVVAGAPSGPCHLGAGKIPPGFNWDLWLGPAPRAEYHPYRCSGSISSSYGWRAWRDYSGGSMTYYGAHYFDIVQWALGADETGPVEIVPLDAADPAPSGPEGKMRKMLTYRYANGVTVYNGTGPKGTAIEFTGTEGVLGFGGSVKDRRGFKTWPDGLVPPAPEAGRSRAARRSYSGMDHVYDFLDCIQTRKTCICDAAIACRSVTVSHLGNIACWLGRPLKWDPAREEIVDDPQASRWLDRPRRAPWRL